MINQIKAYYEREIAAIHSMDFAELEAAVQAIKATYDRGGTIYTFGNGGSAATASHMVCDFNKGISENLSKKFNVVCLNDNTSIIMAIANDRSYDDVFYAQLENKLQANDIGYPDHFDTFPSLFSKQPCIQKFSYPIRR